MKIKQELKVIIEVKRPNGDLETVDITEIATKMAPDHFKNIHYQKMIVATRNAGKGEILSYNWEDAEYEKEEADYQTKCERCGEKIDTRTAYSQTEWSRFNGQKVQVIAHYCDDCKQLLTQIGLGEHTDMEERSTVVPGAELAYKGE